MNTTSIITIIKNKTNICLVLFLPLLIFMSFAHCQSIYELKIQKPIIMPYHYYKVHSDIKNDIKISSSLPWDYKQDIISYDYATLNIYFGTNLLDESLELIKQKKIKKASMILGEALNKIRAKITSKTETIEDLRELKGKIHNNLAICYILIEPIQVKNAKFHVDQAGVLLESSQEVLDNVRVIAYFLQKDTTIIKK